MKLKKILCIMTTVIMSMGLLTGCGTNTAKNNNTTGTNKTAAVADNKAANSDTSVSGNSTDAAQSVAAQTTGATGKTLVVYYSATGSTRAVAQTIAQTAGADIFEITPVKPYTNEDLTWTNNNSRVSKEHNDESLRNVELTKVTPDNWASYDTVFIGYPIWWYIAAWPVDNFVKGNDFTGKTVIPFCTSASSGMGESGTLLQKMAGTGTWQEGHRFSSGASSSDVQKWVDSLKINK